jgi:hypothetical protein
MWFMFGLITFTVSAALVFRRRFVAPWHGTPGHVDNIPFQYERGLREPGSMRFGVEAPRSFNFSLKSECWIDRLFKRIGITAEFQTGNRRFDDTVYIVSDDPRIEALLRRSDDVRKDVLRLISATPDWSVYELRCAAGRLWVDYKQRTDGIIDTDSVKFIAVPALARLAAVLQAFEVDNKERKRDPFAWKAATLLAFSTGLAINGYIQFMRYYYLDLPDVVDGNALWHTAAVITAVIVAALVVSCLLILGHGARTHLVLLELLVVGGFGVFTTAETTMRDLNMDWDTQAAQRIEVSLVRRYVHERSGRMTRPIFYLVVEDWTQPGWTRSLRVSDSLYDSVQPGQRLVVHQRPGYFGFRWIEDISVADRPGATSTIRP